jgi:hypothetical protein
MKRLFLLLKRKKVIDAALTVLLNSRSFYSIFSYFVSAFSLPVMLKKHFHEKVFEIIPFNHDFGPNSWHPYTLK